jgi:hypothetical protein
MVNLLECCFSRRQSKTPRISINWQMALLFLVLQRKNTIVVYQCAGNGDFFEEGGGSNGFCTARLLVALVLTNTIVTKIETQNVPKHVRLLKCVHWCPFCESCSPMGGFTSWILFVIFS